MQSCYYGHDSLLSRLNPLSKIVATAPVILFLSLTADPVTPTVFMLLFGITTIIWGKIPVMRYLWQMAPLLLLVSGFLIFYPLAVNPVRVTETGIAYRLGPLVVYWDGIIFGVTTALRILSLIFGTMLFVMTTDPADFIRALVQQWRVPYRIGYSALAAYRFIPMLQSELAVIRAAHKVRGISDRSGFRAQIDRTRRYAIPLLATAIRKADRTALAKDSRAFGAYETRTYYRRFAFVLLDWIFIGAFLTVSLALVLFLAGQGLLAPLAFMQEL